LQKKHPQLFCNLRVARACRKEFFRSCKWPDRAVLNKFKKKMRQAYISVLTDPTRAGWPRPSRCWVISISPRPKALVGFAGPRVIQQTINQKLPEGFQRAEFLLEHGMIDEK